MKLIWSVLIVSLLMGPALAGTIIAVEPPATGPSVGETFLVNVVISGVSDLYAFQFDLGFNPGVLEAESVSEGAFLSSGGSTFFIGGTIDNAGGSVFNTANTLTSAVPGVSGTGTLATLQFKALGDGTSALNLSNVFLIDSTLSGVEATLQNSEVSIGAGAANIPEPASVSLLRIGLLCLWFANRWAGR